MSIAGSSNGCPESIGSAFSAVGDGNDLGVVMAQQYRLPIKRRRLVVLGGFPRNTDRNIIIRKLGEYTAGGQLAGNVFLVATQRLGL